MKQGRVAAFTEHVDVMPTMLEWLDVDVPRQCDGRGLQSFLHGRATPRDWRTEAHWEYDFRDSRIRGRAGAHARDERVERRAGQSIRNTSTSPICRRCCSTCATIPASSSILSQDEHEQKRMADYSRRLLSWRMRHTDKTLSHLRVTPQTGLMNLNARGARA